MSLTSHRPTGIGVAPKSHAKGAQNENAQIKGSKIGGDPQRSIRKPFTDITNQTKNRTVGTVKPQEKPAAIIKKNEPEDIEYDLSRGFSILFLCSSHAYFCEYKLPYRVEEVEKFDVLAYVSQPSSMKPYRPLEENYSFDLLQIDSLHCGTLY